MKRFAIVVGLALLALVPLGATSAANTPLAGDLDSSFGSGGVVSHSFGTQALVGTRAIVVQPNGDIVETASSDFGFGLARYLANGSPDPTFGEGGFVETTSLVPQVSYSPEAVALQADGKIVVAGTSDGLEAENVLNQFTLARYNPNGSLDTSFGSDGVVNTAIPEPVPPTVPRSAVAYSLAVLPDGDILAGGTADWSGFPDHTNFAVVRYTPDGSLDPSFGEGGIAQTTFSGYDGLSSIAVQPDGSIVASGDSSGGGHGDVSESIALARYMPDGSPDLSFGTAGKVTTVQKLLYSGGPAALQNGKIVVGGAHLNRRGKQLFGVVARYGTRGRLDAGFGNHGFADVPQITSATKVITQSDGKILVVAANALVRLMPNGRIDTSFGSRGVVSLAGGTPGNVLALQTDGKILVGGALGSDSTLTRLIGGDNCVVPALRGRTLAKAGATLKTSYCKRGSISRRFSDRIRRGRVLSTSPSRGSRLPGGSTVGLVVSRGRAARR